MTLLLRRREVTKGQAKDKPLKDKPSKSKTPLVFIGYVT